MAKDISIKSSLIKTPFVECFIWNDFKLTGFMESILQNISLKGKFLPRTFLKLFFFQSNNVYSKILLRKVFYGKFKLKNRFYKTNICQKRLYK